jgi:hypothetical protein
VRGWTSPAHVVVVHAREIVVDERVRVNDLDGGGKTGRVTFPSGGPVRSENEHAPDSFSTGFQGIANRLGDI